MARRVDYKTFIWIRKIVKIILTEAVKQEASRPVGGR